MINFYFNEDDTIKYKQQEIFEFNSLDEINNTTIFLSHFETDRIGEIYVSNNSQQGQEGIILERDIDYSITGNYEIQIIKNFSGILSDFPAFIVVVSNEGQYLFNEDGFVIIESSSVIEKTVKIEQIDKNYENIIISQKDMQNTYGQNMNIELQYGEDDYQPSITIPELNATETDIFTVKITSLGIDNAQIYRDIQIQWSQIEKQV